MGPTTYLDEAFSAGPIGVYVVAAVLVPPERADGLRLDLRELFGCRASRFHWYEETDAVRRRMLEFIACADLSMLTVAGRLGDVRAQERARAFSLERLLWELRSLRPGHLVLEARQERNNLRDRRVIAAAQRSGKASTGLTYEFGLPSSEPLLWTADAVASATLADATGRAPAMIEIIERCLRRISL